MPKFCSYSNIRSTPTDYGKEVLVTVDQFQFVMSEPESLAQKAKYFFDNTWNLLTTLAVATYLIGFGLRLDVRHESIRLAFIYSVTDNMSFNLSEYSGYFVISFFVSFI